MVLLEKSIQENRLMIKTKEELFEAIKTKFAEDDSEETISLIEDITDTVNDYEGRLSSDTDWKTKYETNDAEWRKKYKDRFFNSAGTEHEDPIDEAEQPKKLKFEDLFTVKE